MSLALALAGIVMGFSIRYFVKAQKQDRLQAIENRHKREERKNLVR